MGFIVLYRADERRMNPAAMQNRWIKSAAVIAGWFFLGLVLSVEVYFTYVWPGREYGRFTTRADWNTVLTWELTPVAGAPAISYVGVYIDTSNNAISPGSVPKQKGYISQLWEKGPWALIVTGNYISKLLDDPNFSTVTGTTRYISAWPTMDFQAAYKFDNNGEGWKRWFNNSTIRLGGTNVLDRSAPFAAGAFNDFYDVKTHSSRGRFVYTQVTKQF